MANYYDYIILTVSTPTFIENVDTMIMNGLMAGGTSPTISTRVVEESPDNFVTKPVQRAMVGTKDVSGRILLHFRLPVRYTESELISFLENGLVNPKPPLSVELIRSADKIIEVEQGEDAYLDYEVIKAANKASLLPYLRDQNDPIYLSHYLGTEPIELT